MSIETPITETITAENTFSDWLLVNNDISFNYDISGTFAADITLQKSYDGGITHFDDEVIFNSPVSQISKEMAETAWFRAGVKTGDFTSGTINIRLGRR